MHYAVRASNMKLMKHIFQIEGFKALQVVNNWQFSLLHTACAETSDEKANDLLIVLEWLWVQGMSLELQDHQGRTPLIWAATRSSIAGVQWCLSRGAHLGHRDHSGRTAIHMAAYAGDSEVCTFLGQRGAVNLLNETTIDGEDYKPISLARRKGHFYLSFEMFWWKVLYSLTGNIVIFRVNYAWYYWGLLLTYLSLMLFMTFKIYSVSPDMFPIIAGSLGFWVIQAICWIVAFRSNIYQGKKPVIMDQHYRCSSNPKADAMSKPIIKVNKNSATYRLQQVERELFLEGIKLISANLAEKSRPGKYSDKIVLINKTLEGKQLINLR